MNETIFILLATFNGEKYLRRQMDSLLAQTYTNWRLFIRDDLSTDNTVAIIEEYRAANTERIQVLNNGGRNIGSVLNFGELMKAACDADYIMFCDQDDEWLPDKIEVTYRKMREEERTLSNQCPLLIFTNFQYSDNNLQPIESKQDFKVNTWKEISFPHLLAQNPVYGCTVMMNGALVRKVIPIPAEAENHDYWIALIASFVGRVSYLDKKTVRYRQHGHNISGSFDNSSLKKRFARIALQKGNFSILRKKRVMLNKLGELYYNSMNESTKKELADFLLLYQKKSPSLFYRNIKNDVVCQTTSQTILMYASFLFIKQTTLKAHQLLKANVNK